MAKSKADDIIELTNLTKTYGKSRGISDVTLSISEGEVFGFLGPNGAGKSTTINTMLDLLRPTSGSAKIFGLDVRTNGVEVRHRVGFLSGDMVTDPALTGAQYLDFIAHRYGGVDKVVRDKLIERLRCETDKKIKRLSRGNRQKIGLVAALMHDPELLILDEPTSGLDPLIQEEFAAIITERKHAGKTTFMSSHVLSEVQVMCDRVGFIRDGRLIRVSLLDELVDAAPRTVTLRYHGDTSKLKRLSGASDIETAKDRLHFHYRGDYNALIAALAGIDVVDLEITEPSLDELFMSYYQGGDHV